VAVANSAAFGTAARVSNIGQAVARLGTALTRQVVCATALRSVFEPTVSHTLWNHSLAMAETAAGTATRSGRVETGKAFLAGLVHDVGKLVILQLDGKAREIYERLTRKGCPETVIEQVVFGQSHAAIGALVLTKWHFDESIVAAVEHHHEPQRAQSALCGILYLCENQHDGVATVRSEWREELARSCAGLPEKNDVGDEHRESAFSALRFAA